MKGTKTSEMSQKTWEVFQKTWEIFPETWEIFPETLEINKKSSRETIISCEDLFLPSLCPYAIFQQNTEGAQNRVKFEGSKCKVFFCEVV